MKHLTKNELKTLRQKLDELLEVKINLLAETNKEIQNLKEEKSPLEEIKKNQLENKKQQKEKLESKVFSIKKSQQSMENGKYGLDICSNEPIPYQRLFDFPDIKVVAITPRVTCNSGGRSFSYGKTVR